MEWNYEDKQIDVMFLDNDNFIYSIISDKINEHGENLFTKDTQLNFISRISTVLKNV